MSAPLYLTGTQPDFDGGFIGRYELAGLAPEITAIFDADAVIGATLLGRGQYLQGENESITVDGIAATYAATSTMTFNVTIPPGVILLTPIDVVITNDNAVSAAFPITVTNRAPVFDAIATQSASVGELFTLTVVATDPDGGAVTIAAFSLPPRATFVDNVINWTPTVKGLVIITLVATGVAGAETTTDVVITVKDPLAPNVNVTVQERQEKIQVW